MNNNLNKVTRIRRKIFKTKKYNDFDVTLNKMMIPSRFDANDCIPPIFSQDDYMRINNYEYGEYNKLYRTVQKQIIDLPVSNNPIIVVHPFYPILRHANFLVNDKTYLNAYLKYEKGIIELLKHSKNDIILFESPDSFARYTYSFLKYHRIKKIVFTGHSYGNVLDEKELENLNITEAMIAGCYGEHCIKDVEKQLPKVRIKRIDNLIMERFC